MEDVVDVPLGEIRSFTTAAGGTVLSTTATLIALPPLTDWISLIGRNFAGAVVLQYALNPWLTVVKTTDALVTEALSVEYGDVLQDADTSTTMGLNSFGAGTPAFIYVGSHIPFRGVRVIIGNTNSNASVLTVKYWKTDSTWTTISPTDGTASGGAAFAQTGNVTWTMPTTWQKATLNSALNAAPAGIGDTTLGGKYFQRSLYWTRWEVSLSLDASVTWTGALAMNRSTAYAELPSGTAFTERIAQHFGGIGCIEALVDAGSGNLLGLAGTTRVASSFS